jgi:DNA-binding XRE family transcriptional regulator/tRNA1(Val) A37 N6-methylase TrmN6
MNYQKLVIKLRERLVLSQTELAEELDVSYQTVNRWENGHHQPSIKEKRKILDLCEKNGIKKMKITRTYGKVYTPDNLADFLVSVLKTYLSPNEDKTLKILDPACGEGSLLFSASKELSHSKTALFGIDIDSKATDFISKKGITAFNQDAICPSEKLVVEDYWHKAFGTIDLIIANPPWSSDRIYPQKELKRNGYHLDCGQYDAYSLFIELAYRLLKNGGFAAFIVPDSLFTSQNSSLRKFLSEKTHIHFLARLGEKFFPKVSRSTALLIFEKRVPNEESICKTLRLNDADRKMILSDPSTFYRIYEKKARNVRQSSFAKEPNYQFVLDVKFDELSTIKKIKKLGSSLSKYFKYGRGVEISKHGTILTCPNCHKSFSASRHIFKNAICPFCGANIDYTQIESIISEKKTKSYKPIFVGEDIQRLRLLPCKYIKPDIQGLKYKKGSLYLGPKLLVRKTGLGIKAVVDTSNSYTNQTVHILSPLNDNVDSYYFAGMLSSRTVYYFYTKIYGENEWKSHPYITKKIIMSLPIRDPATISPQLVEKISALTRTISLDYSLENDIALEKLVFEAYELNEEDIEKIRDSMDSLPDLGAINMMRFN